MSGALRRNPIASYGPSTRADFAAWVGIRAGDVDPWWSQVEDELTQVEFSGTSWVLTEDLAALQSAPKPKGLRLLPPRDPYTQTRDRESILDKKYHRDVWKAVGEPGTVLADGKLTGIWRPHKSGRKMTVTITAFGSLGDRHRRAFQQEAEQIALLRGSSSVDIELDTY